MNHNYSIHLPLFTSVVKCTCNLVFRVTIFVLFSRVFVSKEKNMYMSDTYLSVHTKNVHTDFDALLSDDPHYGPALLNRAMVAQESGRYPQALADLETYLALPSGDDEYRAMAERTTHVLREIVAELPGATVGNEREA